MTSSSPGKAKAAGNLMVQALGWGILSSMGEILDHIGRAFPTRQTRLQDTAAWEQASERCERIRQ